MRGKFILLCSSGLILALTAGASPASAQRTSEEKITTKAYSVAIRAEADCVRAEKIPNVTVSSPRPSAPGEDDLVYFTTVEATSTAGARQAENRAMDAAQRCAKATNSQAIASSYLGAQPMSAGDSAVAITPYGGDFMTWSHNGGYTLLGLNGQGLVPSGVIVAHAHGDGFGTICNYKAHIWGTKKNGSAYSQTSSLLQKCTPIRVGIQMNPVQIEMKNGSGFYGQFFEEGAWVPGIPKATIQA